jgi:hypothetical protein
MSNLVIPITPSGRSNKGELTKWLAQNLESSLKIERFNQNLVAFKNDWCKTAADLYTKRSPKEFAKYVTISSLMKGTAKGILEGNSVRTLANITLKVEANQLTSFSYDTHLGQVTEEGGSGKHRITRAAILKNSRKSVPHISDTNRSERFKGAMGKNATPIYKGRIKGFVPKGSRKIYIRLQPHTWSGGTRQPIAQMYGIPNAYLLNSKRTKDAFNFDQRLKDLWKR